MSILDKNIPEQPYLIVQHGKHGNRYIVSTNEEEYKQAWLALFHCIRYDQYYDREGMGSDQQAWYDGAMQGDWKAAYWLLMSRDSYEYERLTTECLDTVSDMLSKLNVRNCDTCGFLFPSENLRVVSGCIARAIPLSNICQGCDPRCQNGESDSDMK
jgi:hypothetical protein